MSSLCLIQKRKFLHLQYLEIKLNNDEIRNDCCWSVKLFFPFTDTHISASKEATEEQCSLRHKSMMFSWGVINGKQHGSERSWRKALKIVYLSNVGYTTVICVCSLQDLRASLSWSAVCSPAGCKLLILKLYITSLFSFKWHLFTLVQRSAESPVFPTLGPTERAAERLPNTLFIISLLTLADSNGQNFWHQSVSVWTNISKYLWFTARFPVI